MWNNLIASTLQSCTFIKMEEVLRYKAIKNIKLKAVFVALHFVDHCGRKKYEIPTEEIPGKINIITAQTV